MKRPIVHSTAPSSTRLRSDNGDFTSCRNAISQAADSLDQRRAELTPQPRDEHFNRVRVAIEVLRVNVLGQLALRYDAVAMVHQVRQHPEFVTRQLDGDTVTRDPGQPQ